MSKVQTKIQTMDESVLTAENSLERSHEVKRARVVDFLREHNLDGVVLTLQSNFAWYTDGARSHINLATEEGVADLLVTRDEEHLFVSAVDSRRMTEEELPWKPEQVHINAWWEDAGRKKAIRREFGSRVALDSGTLRQEIARLRYSLLPHEIERYRELGKDVASVLWEVAHVLRQGMTELDLAAEISLRLVRKGIDPLIGLVAFDDRVRTYRHALPTTNTLKKSVMVGVGGRRQGLTAVATRQIVLGGISEEFRKKHEAVVRVDAWVLQQTRPQRRVAEIFAGLKEQYAVVGYPNEWYLHHQGGAIGYLARDYRATEKSKEVLQQNQAFSWNPTITGTKSEDSIIVREGGCEVLTQDGHWPMLSVEVDGAVVTRPDLLILD